ncbi:MAG: ABC transporter permease [Defluviitaleaceae bacterium]|nr:ABC transporter permease [Defluviitaleaceae bacterium]
MRIFDVFSMALRNMFKRKVRTFLTVLGVVIGSVAITLMMSLGVAVNLQHQQQIEQLGHRANRINVWVDTWSTGLNDIVVDDDMVASINAMPGVRVATPIFTLWTSLTFTHGPYMADLQIRGILPEAMPYMGLNVSEGRLLTDDDDFNIVFGSAILTQFRHPRDRWNWQMSPWGDISQEATLDVLSMPIQAFVDFGMEMPGRPYMIEGVGILDGMEWEAQTISYMTLDRVVEIQRDLERFLLSMGSFWGTSVDDGFSELVVIAENADAVSHVAEGLRALGLENVWYDMEWINQQRESTESLQNLLSAIGAVALFVAAIGIANTMVMAIYERRKEIGVMKVIGASIKDIRRLFLLEAAMIGALGGVLGMALSALVSYIMNTVGMPFLDNLIWGATGDVSVIPPWLYMLGFGFSCGVGLISGFLPARRATKISALEAIRTS